ncbi:MAG: NfeD family protein [Candidatus Nealsonbacteria bacterium]
MSQIKFLKKLAFLIILGLLFFNLLLPLQEVNSQPEGQLTYLAEIEGEIRAGTHQYLKRVIKLAEEEKAEFLVIKLDTPGGLLKSTKDIVDSMLETKTKTIVFVHKEGGWAYSAGTFILLAADFAVLHPEASIGAAQPRQIIGETIEVDQKMIEGTASWIKSLAEIHQRNAEVAEKFVRENLTLTGKEAKEIGIADETAKTLDELFLKLNISGPKIREIKPSFSEKFFDFLSHPYLVSFLLTIGGLAIIMAIRAGEFEISGIIGIIALLIGLWGMGVITFSFLGIGLILLGLFLLMMEIFVEPGFGIFGIGGAIAIVLGIFTFEAEPFLTPGFFEAMTMVVIGAVLSICIFFVIIGRGVAKTLRVKPKTGPEALIGLQAEVVKILNPLGQVKIKGEIWSAESFDKKIIPKKLKVEIVKVEGNTLIVKKI